MLLYMWPGVVLWLLHTPLTSTPTGLSACVFVHKPPVQLAFLPLQSSTAATSAASSSTCACRQHCFASGIAVRCWWLSSCSCSCMLLMPQLLCTVAEGFCTQLPALQPSTQQPGPLQMHELQPAAVAACRSAVAAVLLLWWRCCSSSWHDLCCCCCRSFD